MSINDYQDTVTYAMAIIEDVLKEHCAGEENKAKAEIIIEFARPRFEYYGLEISDAIIRKAINDLRNSDRFTRIIGTSSKGTWLACKGDKTDPNKMLKSRAKTVIETAAKNGVNLNFFYAVLNELKEQGYPEDDQMRLVFNKERPFIKRYSNDLKKGG